MMSRGPTSPTSELPTGELQISIAKLPCQEYIPIWLIRYETLMDELTNVFSLPLTNGQ